MTVTKSSSTGVYDNPVERGTARNNDIMMDTKAADHKGTIKSSEGTEHETTQSSQTNADDVRIDENPSFAETKFTDV